MSYFPHPVFLLTGGVSLITLFGSNTSTATSVTAPASIMPGDLMVLHDCVSGGSGAIPAGTIPSGFTQINNIITTAIRQLTSYKLANGTEGGTSISGTSAGTNGGATKTLYVFRGDVAATSLTVGSANQEATTGDPSSQNVTASSGIAPLIVFGCYGTGNTSTDPTRTFSPAETGEINAQSAATIPVENFLKYRIYNLSPSDTTIDMNDVANQCLQSFYIQMA